MVNIDSLDKKCQDILVCLAMNNEMGFNELYRTLQNINYDITKPTLSRHLEHLLEEKILTKKKVGKQRINYELTNWHEEKGTVDNENSRKVSKFIENHINGEEAFKSLSAGIQANLVASVLMITSLEQLEVEISSILNPENAFKRELEFMITLRIFALYKKWLLDECQEYKKEFVEQILQALISTQKKLFDAVSELNC